MNKELKEIKFKKLFENTTKNALICLQGIKFYAES